MKITNTNEAKSYIQQIKRNKRENRLITCFKVISLILLLAIAYNYLTTPKMPETITITKEIDNLTPKIEQLKAEVLDTLQACESNGYTDDIGLIKFDSNAKASIGLYQFQKATVISYYKTLYNKNITGKEAVIIALDTPQARQLASDIIFKAGKADKGINNWYNCNNKHQLSAKVEFINKLIK